MGAMKSTKLGGFAGGFCLCAQPADVQACDAVADFVDTCAGTITFEHGQDLAFLDDFAFADAQFCDDTAVSGLDDLRFVLRDDLALGADDLVDVEPCGPGHK